jgi:lipopolysaccharide export system protein LptA
MPIQVIRLRRWLAFAAIAVSLVVAGVFLHRRKQAADVLKGVPGKIGLNIQQTAEGFKVSKSEQGRTLFTIQASKAVQFKMGGRAELHNVTITLFGRDSSRFDQIYGDDFSYDPQSGDVLAKGEVRIDLEANPEGLINPDQSIPTDLKNPVHLVTRNLVFNQKSGDAFTDSKVDLSMPQATGSALGLHYAAKDNVLTLKSNVDLILHGEAKARVTASRGVITKDPRQVVLEHPRLTHGSSRLEAQMATLYLRPDNTVDHVVADEGVDAQLAGDSPIRAHAQQAEFTLNDAQDGLSSAVFHGDVRMESGGDHSSRADAGRVTLDFAGRSLVSRIHASENVKLVDLSPATGTTAGRSAQQVEVNAPAMDFFVAKGRHLDRAETSAGGKITILPVTNTGTRTVVTARKFDARFVDNSLQSLHGSPDAKIVSSTEGQPDRTSTSQTVDVAFRPAGGIDSVLQQGSVHYVDGDRDARADRARYTPASEIVELTGSPRVTDKALATTAQVVRINRTTGDATAEGNVKSTYSDLHEQPTGALLASSSPIHITARTMAAHRSSAVATYSGDVRIWQDANVVEAPTIQFDRDRRSVVAEGSDGKPVSTVLVQVAKNGGTTPVAITSKRLTYTDDQHRAQFEGGVVARGADFTITADRVDAYMFPRGQAQGNQALKGQGRLDRIVAEGSVNVEQPTRRAEGDRLVYTAADDKFVLTGKTPSIFDAEHGKITGDSLTFYKRDDRVLVEGRDSSPSVTQTRVAR